MVKMRMMEPEKGLNAGFILLTFLNEQINNRFVAFACKYLTFDTLMKKQVLIIIMKSWEI